MGTEKRYLASWSGGKDGALALMRTLDAGLVISGLLHFDRAWGAHGVDAIHIHRQARAMDIALINKAVKRDDNFEELFKETVNTEPALRGIVFGDIYLEEHRDWIERVCDDLGIEPLFPLWGEDTKTLASEFLSRGGETTVVSAKTQLIEPRWVGRMFDEKFISYVSDRGLDPCGEQGEFHTFVTYCPFFETKVPITGSGISERDGHWFYDIENN